MKSSKSTKNILFICGSLNQTRMMYKISNHLSEYNNYFTPYYSSGILKIFEKLGLLDFTIMGGKFRETTLNFLHEKKLNIDFEGRNIDYDLVVTCSDLIIQSNIINKKIILVQEGMTDPENFLYYLVKYFKLPRYLASTSTTGLSKKYKAFCVASEGYKNFFIKKGIPKESLIVTGIPNFDNCIEYLNNDFPYKNYVLVATSDSRETFKYENRKKFIYNALKIANGRQLIFKLHPNENTERAIKEINKYAPNSLIFTNGNTEHMIANCSVLITRFSSVIYIGIVLRKEVYSEFDINELKNLTPLQNRGTSARKISEVCRKHLIDENEIFSKRNSDVAA